MFSRVRGWRRVGTGLSVADAWGWHEDLEMADAWLYRGWYEVRGMAEAMLTVSVGEVVRSGA
jgi:hypothetical protein